MFNRQQLRRVIDSCSDKQTTDYIRKVFNTFSCQSQTETTNFITKTMQQISYILTSSQENPQTRMKTHKIVIYLILMADPLIYEIFGTEVFPIFKEFCMWNPTVTFAKRGQGFFNKTKYYLQGSFEEKQNLSLIGSKFILFCLQTVLVLAKWLPTEVQDQNQQSNFNRTHQNLLKQGITFPEQKDLIFYTDHNVEAIQNTIKQLQQQIIGSQYSSIKSITRNEFCDSQLALDSKKIKISKDTKNKRLSDDNLKNSGGQSKSKFHKRKSLLNRRSASIPFKQDQIEFQKSKELLSKKVQQNNVTQQYLKQNRALRQQLDFANKRKKSQLRNLKFQYQQQISHLEIQLDKKQLKIKELEGHIRKIQLRQQKATNTSFLQESLRAKQTIIKQLQMKNEQLQFQIQQFRRRENELVGQNTSERKSKNQQGNHTRLNSVEQTTRNIPAQYYQSGDNYNQYSKTVQKQKSETDFRKFNCQIDVEHFQKIKIQNIKFREKLLTDCAEPIQFKIVPANKYDFNRLENHENMKHMGYFPSTTGSSSKLSQLNSQLQKSYPLFQPYISNLPSQNKTRLKKAIMRDKQLLIKTKHIQIGCLTSLLRKKQLMKSNLSPRHKYQSQNSKYPELRVIMVITNVSDSDFHDFSLSLVHHNRQLTIKSNPDISNCMVISSGQQIKIELTISLLRNNFRSLIAKIKYKQGIIQPGEQQKLIVLMPLTKFKFMQQCVLTPIPQKVKANKLEKVFIIDRKIITTFDKIGSFFKQAVQKVDKNQFKSYNMKLQFLRKQYFVQIAELDVNARISILYEQGQYSLAQCLLQQFAFVLGKQ